MSTTFLESAVERMLAEALDTSNFYSVCSPFDRTAIAGKRLREQDHLMWQEQLPDAEDDLQLVLATLMRHLGRGETYLKNSLEAHRRLAELPLLKALQEDMFHLDLDRLKAIDLALCKVDFDFEAHVAIIDRELTEYLTPTRPNQLLPSAAKIRRKINDIITALDGTISPDDDPVEEDQSFGVIYEGNHAFITVKTDPATAHEMETRVRKTAAEADCSQAEAFHRLVTGEASTEVTLNLYRAKDVDHAPGWLPGVGFIPADVADTLAERATVTRDMDALYDKVSQAYYTPPDIRAVVVGLDGTCSYVGCNRSAHHCEMDHRVDYKDGGQTTAANLAPLCPGHHNIKTDGRAHYLIDPHTRDKYFLFEDGTWVVSEADGPLTPKNKNWVQTVGQRTAARRARIRAESQARRAAEPQHHPPPPEDVGVDPWSQPLDASEPPGDPPPF